MARNVWLILTYTFFGPAIGAGVFLLLLLALDPILSAPDTSGTDRLLSAWPFILSMGYALGLVPGFVSAVAQIIATNWLPTRPRRLLAAPAVGGVISMVLIGLFLQLAEMGIPLATWWLFLLLAIPGAVTAFICFALVEFFHPLPRPA